jgi:glutamate-1-semialdehyde 2,1-aminomutase
MYPDLNSQSAKLFERAKAVMPGGNTRLTVYFPPYPVYAVRGEGCRIWDADGVERLDCVNNYSVLIHGHRHPKVMEALKNQTDRILPAGLPTEEEIALAEELCSRLPGVDKIRFANSGTEAVMYTIRAAREYTGRSKVAKAEGAYHGGYDHMNTSQTVDPENWGPADAPATTPFGGGIPPGAISETITFPYNNVEATRRILEQHADELAAVVIDPFCANLRIQQAKPEFLNMVRDFTREKGVCLIFDEVLCFRLGYNGAQGRVGVTPDFTCLGKVLGGGLPMGAIGGRDEVMEVFNHLSGRPRVIHSGTHNANPMTMAAGLATLQLMTPKMFEHHERLGDRLRKGLREAMQLAGIQGSVTGKSSLVLASLASWDDDAGFRDILTSHMGAGSTSSAKAKKTDRGEMERAFHRHMLNNGVFCVEGSSMFTCYMLSTVMTEKDVDFIVEKASDGYRMLAKKTA